MVAVRTSSISPAQTCGSRGARGDASRSSLVPAESAVIGSVALSHKLRLLVRSFIAASRSHPGQRAQTLNVVRKRISRRAHSPSRTDSHENTMHFIGIDRRATGFVPASTRTGRIAPPWAAATPPIDPGSSLSVM
jgi:hypothetical protein